MKNLIEFLLKKKITPNQMYVLWSQFQGVTGKLNSYNGELEILKLDGWLSDDYKPTTKGLDFLNDVEKLFKKTKVIPQTDGWMEFIKVYREKWPKGKKGSPAELPSKFEKFFRTYPEYKEKWNLILKATELYLSEASSQFHFQADHFIHKETPSGPRIAIFEYLERVEEGESEDLSIYQTKTK